MSRYTSLLTNEGRVDDALRVARLAAGFPEIRGAATRLIGELESTPRVQQQP